MHTKSPRWHLLLQEGRNEADHAETLALLERYLQTDRLSGHQPVHPEAEGPADLLMRGVEGGYLVT